MWLNETRGKTSRAGLGRERREEERGRRTCPAGNGVYVCLFGALRGLSETVAQRIVPASENR
jgi:hypothetical protein